MVRTESDMVRQARKGTLEFLLTNHPLDCPVCDKGGECELQDMVFRYGAGESRFTERKVHTSTRSSGRRWCIFDAPRCILCYRCVRVCNEGMGVGALGVVNRGVISEIVPNHRRSPGMRRVRRLHRHLPGGRADQRQLPLSDAAVGDGPRRHHLHALRRRLQDHAGRAQRQDHPRQQSRPQRHQRRVPVRQGPLRVRFQRASGAAAIADDAQDRRSFEPISWSKALEAVATKFSEVKARGGKFGVIGSNHTTNEENYFLQKFARQGLGTKNIDHHRTGDLATFFDALSGKTDALATAADLYTAQGGAGGRAPIWRSSIRCCPSRCAPTSGITRRTFTR